MTPVRQFSLFWVEGSKSRSQTKRNENLTLRSRAAELVAPSRDFRAGFKPGGQMEIKEQIVLARQTKDVENIHARLETEIHS